MSEQDELQRKVDFCQMSDAALEVCRSHYKYFTEQQALGTLMDSDRPQLELAMAREQAGVLEDIPPKKLARLNHRFCLIRPAEKLLKGSDQRLLQLCSEIVSNTFFFTREELAYPPPGSILTDTLVALQRLPNVRSMSEGELRRRIARHVANRLLERSGAGPVRVAPTKE